MKIILVKRGEYYDSAYGMGTTLTEPGRQQILSTANKIRDQFLVPARNIYIFHCASGVRSCRESAEIIANICESEVKDDSDPILLNPRAFIKNHPEAKVVIIVLLGVGLILEEFLERILGLPKNSIDDAYDNLGNGQGFVVNFEESWIKRL